MENKDKGADAMVMLNMEVEKRILQVIVSMLGEAPAVSNPELDYWRSQARSAVGLVIADVLRTDMGVGGAASAVRAIAADCLGANASAYDNASTVRYNTENAIRRIMSTSRITFSE